jgi:hypothetical protein
MLWGAFCIVLAAAVASVIIARWFDEPFDWMD